MRAAKGQPQCVCRRVWPGRSSATLHNVVWIGKAVPTPCYSRDVAPPTRNAQTCRDHAICGKSLALLSPRGRNLGGCSGELTLVQRVTGAVSASMLEAVARAEQGRSQKRAGSSGRSLVRVTPRGWPALVVSLTFARNSASSGVIRFSGRPRRSALPWTPRRWVPGAGVPLTGEQLWASCHARLTIRSRCEHSS